MTMKKTLPLLLAGLLAAGGAMAQAPSGDTSMTTQPGSPSQQLNSNSGGVPSNLPGSGSASSADSASSTSVMGAGPSSVVVVPVVPVAVVPAPVMVEERRFGRGNVATRAVDTGNGTLEANGGPYDDAWWGPRPVYVYVPR